MSGRLNSTKRPKEVSELIRTLNPDVPYREFEAARQPEALEAVLRYIYALEAQVTVEA